MGCLYCLAGQSATGKDTVYDMLMADDALRLRPIVMYTTRPIREGETDGETYHFTTPAQYEAFKNGGRMIESRVYHTMLGPWYYYTMDDGQVELSAGDYLMITTLECARSLVSWYGRERVQVVLLEIDDAERLSRALNRERQQKNPRIDEICRRFLADKRDYAEENLADLPIALRVVNDDATRAAGVIGAYIRAQRA